MKKLSSLLITVITLSTANVYAKQNINIDPIIDKNRANHYTSNHIFSGFGYHGDNLAATIDFRKVDQLPAELKKIFIANRNDFIGGPLEIGSGEQWSSQYKMPVKDALKQISQEITTSSDELNVEFRQNISLIIDQISQTCDSSSQWGGGCVASGIKKNVNVIADVAYVTFKNINKTVRFLHIIKSDVDLIREVNTPKISVENVLLCQNPNGSEIENGPLGKNISKKLIIDIHDKSLTDLIYETRYSLGILSNPTGHYSIEDGYSYGINPASTNPQWIFFFTQPIQQGASTAILLNDQIYECAVIRR